MGIQGIRPTDSCVRMTPDSYKPTAATPILEMTKSSITSAAPVEEKSLGTLLSESFQQEVVVGYIEAKVVGNKNTKIDSPFATDPNAPKLDREAMTISVGPNGASPGSSGPGLGGTAFATVKWFFGTAVPIIWRSQPVQTAIKAVKDTVDSTVKVVTNGINTAVTAVTSAVNTAVTVVSKAATSAWNWFTSWF